MSTTPDTRTVYEPQHTSKIYGAVNDTLTITKRNLTRLLRVPDSIVFGIIQMLEGWFVSPKIQSASITSSASRLMASASVASTA